MSQNHSQRIEFVEWPFLSFLFSFFFFFVEKRKLQKRLKTKIKPRIKLRFFFYEGKIQLFNLTDLVSS